MRISVSPPATGTIAIRFIPTPHRHSGISVQPATSRRSNFDMKPPIPVGKCVYQLGSYRDMRPGNDARVAEARRPWIMKCDTPASPTTTLVLIWPP